MGELADVGAAGFTDDGQPVRSPGLMRRAFSTRRSPTGGSRCTREEPSLSRDGQMREGAVSAELGFAGYPSVAESLMVARDIALARYEAQPLHVMHVSAKESVEVIAARPRAWHRRSDAASPVPDR